jgi:hypothetical protein
MSNPVIAAAPGAQFAIAYTDFNGDGDDLGIAIRLVDPASAPSGAPAHANATTMFSQYDPDILATSSGFIVAWVDDSNAATAPDVKYRTFGFDLNPTGPELDCAPNSTANEGDIALATWGAGWAAAWRAGQNGAETLQIASGGATWNIGPYRPGPVGSRPALAELDSTHLLVVYAEGTDIADTGIANGSKLRAAVLDLAAPGAVGAVDIPAATDVGLSQSQPNAVRTGGQVFVVWRSEAPLDATDGGVNGEELWLKRIGWNGSALDLGSAELPLPRSSTHRSGDQRLPALAAAPLGASGQQIVTAFDDLGQVFGSAEDYGDVVVEAIPVPLLRLPGDPAQ